MDTTGWGHFCITLCDDRVHFESRPLVGPLYSKDLDEKVTALAEKEFETLELNERDGIPAGWKTDIEFHHQGVRGTLTVLYGEDAKSASLDGKTTEPRAAVGR